MIYILAENLARESRGPRLENMVTREQACFNSRPVTLPVGRESMLSLQNFTEQIATLGWPENAVVGEALVAGVPTRR